MAKISERAIQLRLAFDQRSSLVCAAPNYTPINWWECDLWGVTRAGYAVEYEVKLSLSDFRADAAKAAMRLGENGWARETKRELLAAGSKLGPTRFFYVFPKDLAIPLAEVPEWAGIMRARVDDGGHHLWVSEERAAKRLHAGKVSKREIILCQRRMWFRYWETLKDVERLVDDNARTRKMLAVSP